MLVSGILIFMNLWIPFEIKKYIYNICVFVFVIYIIFFNENTPISVYNYIGTMLVFGGSLGMDREKCKFNLGLDQS